MEISVKQSRYQAAFMLAALRELREDSRELKKKRKETETAEQGEVLGPLLGPAIKADKGPASPPPGFATPENLESIGLEMDLPVGFKRLRWAMLNSESRFMKDAVFAAEAKYEEYVPCHSRLVLPFKVCSFSHSVSLHASAASRWKSGQNTTRRLAFLCCQRI